MLAASREIIEPALIDSYSRYNFRSQGHMYAQGMIDESSVSQNSAMEDDAAGYITDTDCDTVPRRWCGGCKVRDLRIGLIRYATRTALVTAVIAIAVGVPNFGDMVCLSCLIDSDFCYVNTDCHRTDTLSECIQLGGSRRRYCLRTSGLHPTPAHIPAAGKSTREDEVVVIWTASLHRRFRLIDASDHHLFRRDLKVPETPDGDVLADSKIYRPASSGSLCYSSPHFDVCPFLQS